MSPAPPYQNPTQRTLSDISKSPGLDLSSGQEDLVKLLQTHNYQINFLAQNQKQLQQGVNTATQNPIQEIQQFVGGVTVLLTGGELADGIIGYGDLKYILPVLGALFGFGDEPFPIDLFSAARKFFFGYVVPQQQFTDLLNTAITNWGKALGIDPQFVKDVTLLNDAWGNLFGELKNLLPSFKGFFDALGMSGRDLGPLGQKLKPILDVFDKVDLTPYHDLTGFVTGAMDQFIVHLTKVINFIDSVLRILGSGADVVNSPDADLTLAWSNLHALMGSIKLGVEDFDPLKAGKQWIARLLLPVSHLTDETPDLQLDSGFDNSDSLANDSPAWAPEGDDAAWVWDVVGHAGDGSAKVVANGTAHALLGTVVPVVSGQKISVDCWAKWSGFASAPGNPIAVQLVTDTATQIPIDSITDSAAGSSADWTELTGTYTVTDADITAGVTTVRTRLLVDTVATAGSVWFDDVPIRRINLLKQSLIQDLESDLAAAILSGDWEAFRDDLLVALFGDSSVDLTGWTNVLQHLNPLNGKFDVAQFDLTNIGSSFLKFIDTATGKFDVAQLNLSNQATSVLKYLDGVTGKFDIAQLNLANLSASIARNIDPTTFLYDAAQGFKNQATSLLRYLSSLGKFDVAQLDLTNKAASLLKFIDSTTFKFDVAQLDLTNKAASLLKFIDPSTFKFDVAQLDLTNKATSLLKFVNSTTFKYDVAQLDLTNKATSLLKFIDGTTFKFDIAQLDLSNQSSSLLRNIDATTFLYDAAQGFKNAATSLLKKLNVTTGLYDGSAGFDNQSTSLLKYLSAGANLGQFDVAQLDLANKATSLVRKLNSSTGLYDASAGFDNLATSFLKFINSTTGKFDIAQLDLTNQATSLLRNIDATTFLYDAGQGFKNASTSLLKFLTVSGTGLGQFDIAQLNLTNKATSIVRNIDASTFLYDASVGFKNAATSLLKKLNTSTGLYDGSAGFDNQSTSILRYLSSVGKFDVAQFDLTNKATSVLKFIDATTFKFDVAQLDLTNKSTSILKNMGSSGLFDVAQLDLTNKATSLLKNINSTTFKYDAAQFDLTNQATSILKNLDASTFLYDASVGFKNHTGTTSPLRFIDPTTGLFNVTKLGTGAIPAGVSMAATQVAATITGLATDIQTHLQGMANNLFGSGNAPATSTINYPTLPHISIGGVVNDFESHIQSVVDNVVGPILGGSGGNSPALVATALSQIPHTNVLVPPNPGSGITHDANANGTPVDGTGTSSSLSWSHPVAADANFLTVRVGCLSGPTPVAQVLCGTTAMTLLANESGYTQIWGLLNPPSGTQTISVQITLSSSVPYLLAGESDSYFGVASVGTSATASGTNGNPSQTVPSATGCVILQAFTVFCTSSEALTAYNQTSRYNSGGINNPGYGYLAMLAGDANGASSEAFSVTATPHTTNSWYAAAVNLVPIPSTPLGSGFKVMRQSTGTASLTANPGVLPGSYFDTSDTNNSADYGYDTTTNTVTIGYAGRYSVTIKLLASTSLGTSNVLVPVLYQNGNPVEWGGGASAAARDASSTFLLYCNEGDTLQPGYAVASSISGVGEATGSRCYFEVSLENRSLA